MEKVSIIAQAKKKKPTDLYAMIIIRGFYNRKPVASKSTGYKILIEHWDSTKHLVVPKAPNASLINACIKMKIQEMQAALLKQELCGHNINQNMIYKAVKGLDNSTDFLKFCEDIIKQEYENKETRRTYLSEVSKLKQFKEKVCFADIDYSFLSSYKTYMKRELKNSDNTCWKTFKFINTMLEKAIKIGGIISVNPCKDFDRGTYRQTPKRGLTIEHCIAIEAMASDVHCIPTLKKVAYRFLLMAYSGMRFSDAKNFNTSLHVVDGRIVMEYQKCKTIVNNKMHKRLLNIVNKIDQYPLDISNQKFNQYLKLIQIECKIPFNLHSHLGRHTMGSLLAQLEVPEEQIQTILGHKDRRSTRIYAHQSIANIDRSLEKLNTL